MSTRDPRDYLPDVRDGLTHRERIVLQCLHDLQQEREQNLENLRRNHYAPNVMC
jgi:hypothetical protein